MTVAQEHAGKRSATGRAGLAQAVGDFRSPRDSLAMLWPAGLGLGLVLAAATAAFLSPSRRLWLAYLALGTALPLAVALAIYVRRRLAHRTVVSLGPVALVLGCAALGIGVLHAAAVRFPIDLAVALGAGVEVAAAAAAAGWLADRSRMRAELGSIVLWVAVSLAGWGVAAYLLWWSFPGGLRHPWVAAAFAGSALLVSVVLWQFDRTPNRLVGWAGTAVGVALLAVASVRTNDLFDIHSMYTWEPFIGPAELVRQGGWLLWDVPAQYGFLNEAAIAWIPTASPWEGLFIINSAMCFAMAAIVYAALRSLGGGVVNLVLSAALALVACFMRPGLGSSIIGPGGYPSTGGFRFFWCVAALSVLFAAARTSSARLRPALLLAGNLVWILGLLWSAESAIYTTLVWLPGYLLFVLGLHWQDADRARVRSIAAWLAVPVACFVAALLILVSVYEIGLGHAPDPGAFVDFGLAFQGGVVAYPIDPGGPGWVLFAVYVAALATIGWRIKRGSATASAVLVAAAALVYATASYFVGRSHPNNVWNLAPEMCVALAVMLFFAGRSLFADPLPVLLRLVAAPILVLFLFGAVGDRSTLEDWALRPQRDIAHIDRGLPGTDPNLQALLAAHVRPGDRVAYLADDTDPVLSPDLYAGVYQPGGASLWLPLVPFTAITILPPDRRSAYVERYLSRHPEGGWLIERSASVEEGAWVMQELQSLFVAGASYTSGDYVLTLWLPRNA